MGHVRYANSPAFASLLIVSLTGGSDLRLMATETWSGRTTGDGVRVGKMTLNIRGS